MSKTANALASLLLLLPPVSAFAAVTAMATSTVVVVPYGDWIVAAGQAFTAVLLPVLIGYAVTALWRVAPWLQMFISTQLVERLIRNAADYALNSVQGAAKGRALSVDVGSVVIQRAVQRAVDQAPGFLVAKAGGAEGIAEKVFRILQLDDKATAANTLAPAIAAIPTASAGA